MEDSEDLPEPHELAEEAIEELTVAVAGLKKVMKELERK